MTKCTVFRNEEACGTSKKIQFVHYLGGESISPATCSPRSWDNVQLIGRAPNGMDIIHAWDDHSPLRGCIYSGHWNDGVV